MSVRRVLSTSHCKMKKLGKKLASYLLYLLLDITYKVCMVQNNNYKQLFKNMSRKHFFAPIACHSLLEKSFTMVYDLGVRKQNETYTEAYDSVWKWLTYESVCCTSVIIVNESGHESGMRSIYLGDRLIFGIVASIFTAVNDCEKKSNLFLNVSILYANLMLQCQVHRWKRGVIV